MSDLDTWPSAGMNNTIACIWAEHGDLMVVIFNDGWRTEDTVNLLGYPGDKKKILRVGLRMVAWKKTEYGENWYINPEIRNLVNVSYHMREWKLCSK